MSRNPGRKAFPWPDALGADNRFLTSGSGVFPPPLSRALSHHRPTRNAEFMSKEET